MRPAHLVVCGALVFGSGAGRCGPAAEAEVGQPLVRNYPPGEHLHDPISQAVAQDAAGAMVFANGGDLLSYDGAAWHAVRLPTESAGVRQFAVAADGTVYLAGASVLGYLRGTGGEAAYVSLVEQLPTGARAVDDLRYAVAVGHMVCFSDEEKILVWRDGRFTVVPYPTPAHSHGARLHRVGDTLYVTALARPLGRLAGDRVEAVADDPVLRENQIVAVEAGAAPGRFVVLTAERGFFDVAAGRVTPRPVEANRWLAGKRIFRALRLADGSHVVAFSAVSGDGGARFDAAGRYLGPLDTSAGLVAKTLRDFFCDREGGLWIGLEMGAARLEWPSAASVFNVVNGLGQSGVTDVVRHDGVLWVATGEGVFRLEPADAAGRSARFERVFGAPCYALASHPGGLLALGYAELFASSPAGFGSVAHLPSGGGVLLRSARAPDRVWVGTARGVVAVRHAAEGWREDGAVPGIAEACRALSESADGALWVATQAGGLFRVREGRAAERIGAATGWPEGSQKAGLATWAGEPVGVFEPTARLWRFDAGRARFVPIPGAKELPAENGAEAWTVGGGGDALWLAGEQAVYRVPRDGGTSQRLPHLVVAAAGRVARLYEETGPAGPVLWVGGARGLVRVEVARALGPPVAFAAQLRATNVGPGERLAPEHRPLTFDYAAPRHRFGSAVAYQTRLVGQDDGWSEWEAGRTRSLPHLPAGDYRFEVRARDADGEISAPAALAFAVLPPWWLTGWALLGYALGGTGLVAGVVRWRTRALHRRAERLENVVAERTGELAQRTAELAARNAELVRLNRLELDEKISARLAEEKAHLEVLRYQLNPHFLFNALATISGLTVREPPAARAVTRQLAEFCRHTLTRGRHEFVTLEEEFQLLARYLEVLRAGREEAAEVAIALDPAVAAATIPAFLLLPLVENAGKYGRSVAGGAFRIEISARVEPGDGALAIEVANTGNWVDDFADRGDTPSTRIGLDNIRQRLARSYPGKHTFTTEARDGWVRVRIRLAGAR